MRLAEAPRQALVPRVHVRFAPSQLHPVKVRAPMSPQKRMVQVRVEECPASIRTHSLRHARRGMRWSFAHGTFRPRPLSRLRHENRPCAQLLLAAGGRGHRRGRRSRPAPRHGARSGRVSGRQSRAQRELTDAHGSIRHLVLRFEGAPGAGPRGCAAAGLSLSQHLSAHLALGVPRVPSCNGRCRPDAAQLPARLPRGHALSRRAPVHRMP